MHDQDIPIREYVPLAPLTTFGVGGSARYFVETQTEADITRALAWARQQHVRCIILAGGSNVLVPDEGMNGLVIRIMNNQFTFCGGMLTADAGCSLLALIRSASERGWGGWEKLAGIPGTIGGAVRGNAGAFGTEIRDVVARVHTIHAHTGVARDFSNSECAFSYRHSFFKDNPGWIILSVHIQLAPADSAASAQIIASTIAERERRHLQNVQAAGSFFMNPAAPEHIVCLFEQEKRMKARDGRVPAGWLIEKAGMKGARVGGAQASEQHPNYLVNTGTATAADVRELAKRIKQAVYEQFGIVLREEAVILS